ncbi:transposase [candidate division WOR-3 bacterium]|nr:transposase [candidate division WOR-3 bacterium]
MTSAKRPRKTYTREFKLNAIRLTTEGGVPVTRVARDLGVNENTLHRWRQQLREDPQGAFPGRGRLRPQDEELWQLRRDNRRLRQENTFLKRAAVWLAREARGGSE